jgi:hypothetical protein
MFQFLSLTQLSAWALLAMNFHEHLYHGGLVSCSACKIVDASCILHLLLLEDTSSFDDRLWFDGHKNCNGHSTLLIFVSPWYWHWKSPCPLLDQCLMFFDECGWQILDIDGMHDLHD